MNTYKRITIAFVFGAAAVLALPLVALYGAWSYFNACQVQVSKIIKKFQKYEQA